jgi:DNA-binding transcriptional regulator GbsR (MarR family)
MKNNSDSIQLERLAEQIGNFIEYWGFKKVHGQIWTHIYLSPEPLSALELIPRLKVSKALVSMAMKDLIHYRLILQTKESLEHKNKFFVANGDVFEAIKNVLESREMLLMNQIQSEHRVMQSIQKQNKGDLIDDKKLKALGKMIQGGDKALRGIMTLSSIHTQFLKVTNTH